MITFITFKSSINQFLSVAGLAAIFDACTLGLVFSPGTSLFIFHTNAGSQICEYFSSTLNRFRLQHLWLVRTPGHGDYSPCSVANQLWKNDNSFCYR